MGAVRKDGVRSLLLKFEIGGEVGKVDTICLECDG
jgi:hypothetical protein